MSSPDDAAWNENKQIDQQLAKNKDGNGGAGEHTRTERDDAHYFGQGLLVHIICNFGRDGCRCRVRMHGEELRGLFRGCQPATARPRLVP
jgi:hypothetical protein